LQDVIAREGAVDAVFFATWCPHCRAFLAELTSTPQDTPLALVDLSNTDDPAWDSYNVQVVPTVARFIRGRESARIEARRGVGLSVRDMLLLADGEPVEEGLQRFDAPGR
jgi:thiol-disulfide isomerase/thioredoxin